MRKGCATPEVGCVSAWPSRARNRSPREEPMSGGLNVVVQFCLAHLIRDVKFLTTLPDARDRAYGGRLREALRALFGVIHRREALGARAFGRQLTAARDEVLRQATGAVPPTAASQNMAKRFAKHGEAYFEFVT